jgi:threonylcarbamoyladenosine tRNA methylthiotransferase MtaB
VFRFSPRKGTPAANLADQVDNKTAKERHQTLSLLEKELAEKFARSQFGSKLHVLVEKIRDGRAEGWSDNYLRVSFPYGGDGKIKNSIVEVVAGPEIDDKMRIHAHSDFFR